MRILLDTHALLWWLAGSDRLSAAAHRVIADRANDVFFSAASAWEIATKHRPGRLAGADVVAAAPHLPAPIDLRRRSGGVTAAGAGGVCRTRG